VPEKINVSETENLAPMDRNRTDRKPEKKVRKMR
jgi:hypothetical protein